MSRPRIALLLVFTALLSPSSFGADRRTENVILITLDGARTEEVFGGLDLEILKSTTAGAVEQTESYKKYWAATPEERRQKLMPFLWGTLLTRHGSIAGDAAHGSQMTVTNRFKVSFPGYAEILTGRAHDSDIVDNTPKMSPQPTVLEYLKGKLALDTPQIAAFASWNTFHGIVQHQEGAITANAGLEPVAPELGLPAELARLQFETQTPWNEVRHDAYTFRFAWHYLETRKPRVLYIAFDETDDFAHDKKYDRVLTAFERTDSYLRQLWEWIQSSAQYRNRTSIIITTDHGRGRTTSDWNEHGGEFPGSESIWMAVVSPDSSLRGVWSNTGPVYQNQIAATVARLLGCDLLAAFPQAGKPIERVLPK
jgi:hypothetical protein